MTGLCAFISSEMHKNYFFLPSIRVMEICGSWLKWLSEGNMTRKVKFYTTCTCWKIFKQEWLGFSLCWRHLMWEGDWFNTHLWLFIFSEILCKGNMLFLWKKELESRFTEFCTLHWRSLWITVCKTLSKTVQQLFSCYFILLINIFVTW